MKIAKYLLSSLSLALLVGLSSQGVVAAEKSADDVERAIRQSFKASRPDLSISAVGESAVPGIYEVQFESGPRVYSTGDGQHFFLGDLYKVEAGGFTNLAEAGRQKERVAELEKLKRKDMIIFSPEGKPKGALYVFTDVDCGFCQKLHREVPELNKMGIEILYLAYPRAGVGSPTYKKMVTAWCSKDRKATLTAFKNRQQVKEATCDNPVADQYKLGSQMGVTGTPAIVTTDGQLIPGYMPAARLAQIATRQAAAGH